MRHGVHLTAKAVIASAAVIAGFLIGTGPAAAVVPGAPTQLSAFPAQHGVGVTWKGDYSGLTPTTYSVYSRPNSGSSWAFLASVGASGTNQHAAYIDGSIANGATADYAVTETTSGGESAKSGVVTASRPATDPISGSDNAITVDATADSSLTSEHFDSATFGAVTLTQDTLTGSLGNESASVDLPMVDGPGDTGVTGFHLTTDGQVCSSPTGTLHVIDVAYNANLDPVLFSASYAISCNGDPTAYGDIRWHSTQPYRDLYLSPATISGVGAPVGHSVYVNVEVSNTGTQTAHLGAMTITGANAGDWSESGSACTNVTLAANSDCYFSLIFSPSSSGHRTATVTIADNSARGSHSLPVDGVGEVAPGAPPVTARPAVHRMQITWTPPDNGFAPITSYRVYRTAPGQGQTLVDTVIPADPDVGGSYAEAGLPSGVTYEYSVVATNAAGDSPDAVVQATTPRDEILIDASKAMTTDGDEPATIANPDIRGRVAVVPGSNRIVFPQRYPGDEIDLVVASPYGTVDPKRLTTDGATEPAVSMDGTTVAYVHVDGAGQPSIWTIPLIGGQPTKIAAGVTNPSWLPDGRTLVAERSTKDGDPLAGQELVTVTRNGTIAAISGTTDGHEPAVSPDGTHIAYQLFVQGTGTYSLAVIPVAGGVPATSSATTTAAIEDISWRTDGHELFAAFNGKVRQATYSTGTGPGTLATLSPPDVTGVRWPAYINSEAVSILNPTSVVGRRPSVKIGSAAGASTTCRRDGQTATACPTTWSSITNLAAGMHTLVVSSTPNSGIASSAIWTFTVDTVKPKVTLRSPTAKRTHATKLVVAYIGHDAHGIASYDVRYRTRKPHQKLGSYQYPRSWQGTPHTSRKLRHLKAGTKYCFAVRARDVAGNVSAWSHDHCTKAVRR